jgi:hypothetical protein
MTEGKEHLFTDISLEEAKGSELDNPSTSKLLLKCLLSFKIKNMWISILCMGFCNGNANAAVEGFQ